MKKIVIASNNAGKLREFTALLASFDFEAIAQSEFDVPDAPDPHATFVENALAKARHAARLTGLPALADDSGICVPALAGAPGVFSARYASDGANDTRAAKNDGDNNQKLLRELSGHADKRAFYYCSLVLVQHADDPRPLIADGDWWGEIVVAPRGQGGFGYDPHFFLPEHGCTAAELNAQTKNSISHRGKAMVMLKIKLQHQQGLSA